MLEAFAIRRLDSALAKRLAVGVVAGVVLVCGMGVYLAKAASAVHSVQKPEEEEIGRASCREKV